jgi:hypothetical protein
MAIEEAGHEVVAQEETLSGGLGAAETTRPDLALVAAGMTEESTTAGGLALELLWRWRIPTVFTGRPQAANRRRRDRDAEQPADGPVPACLAETLALVELIGTALAARQAACSAAQTWH